MNLGTNNNIIAMNVRRTIGRNVSSSVSQIESLGSGLRIKRAENDASGVTLSEGFRSELVKLTQNVRNAELGIDRLYVALFHDQSVAVIELDPSSPYHHTVIAEIR